MHKLMIILMACCCSYYGMASFSYGTLVHGLLRDQWHRRLGLTECEMFGALYKDAVHPGDNGRLFMVGGMLVYSLRCTCDIHASHWGELQ